MRHEHWHKYMPTETRLLRFALTSPDREISQIISLCGGQRGFRALWKSACLDASLARIRVCGEHVSLAAQAAVTAAAEAAGGMIAALEQITDAVAHRVRR
jgi:hypothetical protein